VDGRRLGGESGEKKQRKKFGAATKAKVALEAAKVELITA
jgi:hypothetical protein